MTSGRHDGSDGIRDARGMDILRLAQELDIQPGRLQSALEAAAGLLRASRENIRPADKRALRGVAKALAAKIGRLSDDAVRERLVEAAVEEPNCPDKDGLAYYTAWCAARARVARALEGAQDLHALVLKGESFKIPPGRPRYDHWTVAIGSLLDLWTDDLGREVTIPDHPDEPRGGMPSPALRFVHGCMRLLGEEITVQACRTILQNLRDQKLAGSRTMP